MEIALPKNIWATIRCHNLELINAHNFTTFCLTMIIYLYPIMEVANV